MALADGLPRVLYDNEFINATSVVASTETPGFEGANVYDWKTNTSWIPTATGSTLTATFSSPVTADSLAIYKHTLGTTSCTIDLEYFSGSWLTAVSISPSDDTAVMETFTAQSSTQWRILLTYAGDDPRIAIAAFGQFMEFERGLALGYASPYLSSVPDILNAVTKGGNLIGRTQLSPKNQTTMSVNNMTDSFVRDTWLPFATHIQQYPFFMLWLKRDYPDEAAYCWTEGTPPALRYVKYGLISHSFKINQRVN
tara:strand:- start:5813 stop:6574 length:762 start_codon:yes stop_codon:yes gene_type:complete